MKRGWRETRDGSSDVTSGCFGPHMHLEAGSQAAMSTSHLEAERGEEEGVTMEERPLQDTQNGPGRRLAVHRVRAGEGERHRKETTRVTVGIAVVTDGCNGIHAPRDLTPGQETA